MNSHPNDPLHGFTLDSIMTRLVEEYGWDELAVRIRIRCFANDPSIKSTLTFLRKTPWARNKVEELFIRTIERRQHESSRPNNQGEKLSNTISSNSAI